LKLETAGLNDELAQRVIDSKGNNLAAKVVRLIKGDGYEPTTTQRQAREIMGKNFFGVEEAIHYFGINPTKREIRAFAEVPFTERVLESHKDTHILIAVFPLSILEIRKTDSKLFWSSDGEWYENEKFARNRGAAQWQLVRKTPVEDSTFMTWSEQQALLGKDEETPTAQVMVYTIIGHFKKTGERLFERIYVRTSCVDSIGNHVNVGDFGSNGPGVGSGWDDGRRSYLGLSSVRKVLKP
jgi:hypothetical protein